MGRRTRRDRGRSGSVEQRRGVADDLDASVGSCRVAPTTQRPPPSRTAEVAKLMAKWTALKTTGLAPVNAQLKTANLAQLSVN